MKQAGVFSAISQRKRYIRTGAKHRQILIGKRRVVNWELGVEIGEILLQHGADPSLECNGRQVSEAFLGLSRQGGAGEG
jgi:hypothetical protein